MTPVSSDRGGLTARSEGSSLASTSQVTRVEVETSVPGSWRPDVPIAVHRLLRHGEITKTELIPWGSNYTFCVTLELDGCQGLGVYKPRRGERPLWDFPSGTLYRREVAAFLTCQAMGWSFIPATLVRGGPHGVGSIQLFIESEPVRSIRELQQSNDLDLARMAVFDIVTNNADRKAGHILKDAAGKLWGIDQGLCFNVDPKVRTILQHFCGSPIPKVVQEELRAFRNDPVLYDGIASALGGLLADNEVEFYQRRVDWVLANGVYPSLDPYHSVPWPPI